MKENKKLMKGNEAIAEAAIRGGCRCYFGYPITPQSEIPEYMSARMPEVGGTFLQAESEIAAINMVYGAGGAGARAMTSSSSPGYHVLSSIWSGADRDSAVSNRRSATISRLVKAAVTATISCLFTDLRPCRRLSI